MLDFKGTEPDKTARIREKTGFKRLNRAKTLLELRYCSLQHGGLI